eukprot:434978-Pyramimonas_sp.AAC.1
MIVAMLGGDADSDDGAASDGADADHADDDDGVVTSAMKVLEGVRHARAADARELAARYLCTRICVWELAAF